VSVRDVLALPTAYDAFGVLIGVGRVRTVFAEEYVRARPGDRVLDAGCGPGSMLPYLPGVGYTGVDSNGRYIDVARTRYPGARFVRGRIGEHIADGESFDLVIAAGLLHHLNDTEANDLLRLADARLRPDGRLVTLDPCLIENQNRIARWLALRDRGHYVRGQDEQLRLMREVFPGIQATLRHDLLRAPYTHLIVECTRG
jgi:SAM-dependent methyltransferase